jgi:aspartate aminotransferase-like enzyme
MSDVATRLAALKAARDSGVLTVRHGDTSTTFRSLAEIERIIAVLEPQVNGRGIRTIRMHPRSGW